MEVFRTQFRVIYTRDDEMKSSILLTAFFTLSLAATLPSSAAYVRGKLVWKCDFTPEEAVLYGVAECRPDESGRGAAYEPHGGAGGDGAAGAGGDLAAEDGAEGDRAEVASAHGADEGGVAGG